MPQRHRETPPANFRGRRGRGEGLRVVTLPIGATVGRKIEIPPMSLAKFCTEYNLGPEILDRLAKAEFIDVGGLIEANDLGNKDYGLQFGQVAEVKWALKAMLLTCPAIEEVRIPLRLFKSRYVLGGIGGDAGFGEKQGGDGGVGEAPTINMEDLLRFGYMGSGIGAGGNNGEYKKRPNGDEGSSPQPYAEKDGLSVAGGKVVGGKGGHGGRGHLLGGGGGVGGGPIIPLEAVGALQWIQGGRGGDGGAAVEVGGNGGLVETPKFPKPLVVIDPATRLKNMKLKDGEKVNEKLLEFKFDIGEILLNRLHDHGFQTVGGLFEIYDIDLDVAPFKRPNKRALEYALGEFLKEVNKNPVVL
ncbi:hypothetical protein B0H19DRAFT_1070254 [Mycena capillaripes]|nr:hypothetical protein B0H19DRAFT_1070254 [Mycena capillaripes]